MKYSDEINTEILATMGPTLGEKKQILKAVELGVANLRIHMGIRTRDRFQYFVNAREVEKALCKHIDILIDLPTAKPRVGKMKNVSPSKGDIFKIIDAEKVHQDFSIPLRGLSKLLCGLKVGERIVFGDGKLVFKIVDLKDNELFVRCINANGELISEVSSCVFPDSTIEFELFDQDDLEVLQKMKNHGLCPDWIAISFASGIKQINRVKEVIHGLWNQDIKFMAKIESKTGLENFSEILQNVDGIMVARGDLLAFVEPYILPGVQQKLVSETRKKGKTVVVATEMLEKFAESGIVCRPELSDIALAVRQGANAVMLSVESSNCIRSEECILLMNKIVSYERGQYKNGRE